MRGNQKGLTLIELLIAMAIGGMLLGVLVPSIFQMVRGTARTTIEVTALSNVGNAAHWLNRDVPMARETNLDEKVPPEIVNPTEANPLTLNWTDYFNYAGKARESKYYLDGTDLKREYDDDTDDGVPATVTMVARYISDIEFSRNGRVITVNITATPEGVPEQSEKRTYRIYLRPEPE